MTSVSSANIASSIQRVAAPAAMRAVEGVSAAGADAAPSPASGKPARSELPSVSSVAGSSQRAEKLSQSELTRQVQALQSKMDKLNPALAFVLDQDSGRALIQLTDRATKEVIQQFPTEAAIQISKALDQFQKGQLIHLTV